jgi:hypothetical protein
LLQPNFAVSSRHVSRMHCGDTGVAGEIGRIQCKEMGNTVDPHGGDQTCVVDFCAGDRMGHHESAPLVVDGGVVRQKDHPFFKRTYFPVCVSDGQPEAVAICRPRTDIPELGDVLVRVVECDARLGEPGKRRVDDGVVRVVPPADAQQNIRVHQVSGDRYLVVVLVNHLAGECLAGHGRDSIGKLRQLIEPSPNFLARTPG